MSGGLMGPYLEKGEWQVGASLSQFSSDQTFLGSKELQNSSVITGSGTLDFQGAYALTRRLNLIADVPVVLWANWSVPLAGTRYEQKARGIADTVIGGRLWLLNTEKDTKQNVALGLGLRLPTGNSNYQYPYPNGLGQNIINRSDFSGIQPGSGAWGLRLTAQGFRQFRHFSVYGTGLYLFSLKQQNDTLFIGASLSPAGPQSVPANIRYVSTPDSYLFNAGVAAPIPHLKRISFSFGGQVAGVPAWNVLTGTQGFRQPGYIVTILPGLAYNTNFASYSISVPVRMYANILPNYLGSQEDANVAKTSLQVGINFHLGGKRKPHADTGDAGGTTK